MTSVEAIRAEMESNFLPDAYNLFTFAPVVSLSVLR